MRGGRSNAFHLDSVFLAGISGYLRMTEPFLEPMDTTGPGGVGGVGGFGGI